MNRTKQVQMLHLIRSTLKRHFRVLEAHMDIAKHVEIIQRIRQL